MSRLVQGHKATIRLMLNGVSVKGLAEPRMLLSDFLRHEIGATGTHVGCEHGVCGACSVHVNRRVARACLTLAVQVDGATVDTIEGQAASDGSLGIIQESFKRNFALQCGFCTPGIVMSLADYLAQRETVTESEIRELIGGHLCRCTGYTPIIKAAMEAAEELFARRAGSTDDLAGGANHGR